MNSNSKSDQSILTPLLRSAVNLDASDIHLASGESPYFRVTGQLQAEQTGEQISEPQIIKIVESLIGPNGFKHLQENGSFDGAAAFRVDDSSYRFRFNIFRTGGKYALAMRRLENTFRSLSELGLPNRLYDLCGLKEGLILVAGPTGSGKSTTLATLIDQINQSRPAHIITIEDPIEYVHETSNSLIHQRQIGLDTPSFNQALVDAVRQDPDVILVGELRDLETIRTAISAAETGHLVFATVHGADSVGAIERIVGGFPGSEQPMIYQMLSNCLRAVISQHLLTTSKTARGQQLPTLGRVLASEIMFVNSAISNLIANGNLSQIRTVLETSGADGMQTLDANLAKLWRQKQISESVARSLARNPQMLFELAKVI